MADKSKSNKQPEDAQNSTTASKVLHGFGVALKSVFGIIGTLALILFCAGIVFSVIFANYLQKDVLSQSYYSLDGISLDQTSYVYYEDKDTGDWKQLQRLYSTENRIWADLDEIPETLKNSAIAIEDKRFYSHQGVDWGRTIKACLNMFVGNSDSYGGSTITQQLIKNLTKEDEVTVRRKLLEIFRALEFEKKYSKDEIMEWYLNTIYLGEGCYGVKSAANVYFAKSLDDLTIAECACLIGITNNPYMYDPYINEDNNRQRQLTILYQMLQQGFITQSEYDEAVAQKMQFKNGSAEDAFTCSNCGTETGEFSLDSKEVAYTESEMEALVAKAKADAEAKAEASSMGQSEEESNAVNVSGSQTVDDDVAASVPTSHTVYYCPVCGTEIDADAGTQSNGDYSYFVDTVIRDVIADLQTVTGYDEKTCENMVKTGGYSIYSTIDPDAQETVDSVYENLANVPNTTSSQQLQSAIVVIDNESGDIVALSGGVGEKEGSLTLNRATQSLRSPGSSLKPLTVYAPALEYGIITPSSIYEDSPYKDNWPKNQSGYYSGNVTISLGVAKSLNTIAVKVLADLGVEKSFKFATENLDMTTLIDKEEIDGKQYTDIALAPLAMGALTKGVTVREMTNAYAAFPNDGVYRHARTYTKVLDSDGNVVLDNTQETHAAMKETTAWNMTLLLQNAVNTGTGTPARISGMNVAGKTGTTSDDHDRYFAGYTPYYTACVWCGFDTQAEIVLSGSNTNPAVVMWKKVMTQLHEGFKNKDFYNASEMSTVSICRKSGLLATSACAQDVDGNCVESRQMFKDDIPTAYCTGHTFVKWRSSGHAVANDYCAQMPGNTVSKVSVWIGSHTVCTIHDAATVAAAIANGNSNTNKPDNNTDPEHTPEEDPNKPTE